MVRSKVPVHHLGAAGGSLAVDFVIELGEVNVEEAPSASFFLWRWVWLPSAGFVASRRLGHSSNGVAGIGEFATICVVGL